MKSRASYSQALPRSLEASADNRGCCVFSYLTPGSLSLSSLPSLDWNQLGGSRFTLGYHF